MGRATIVLGAGLLAVLAAGCRKPETQSRHLVLCGSRTLTPLMEEIGRRFEERTPGVRVDVEGCPMDRTLADTRSGLADLGMLGRPLLPAETGFLSFAVARDGVAILVNRDNPVRQLTNAQLAGLLTGVYRSWRDVGGPPRQVALACPSDGRAIRDVVLRHFHLEPSKVPTDPGVGSSEQAIQAVANHPFAIGYASLGAAEAAAKRLPVRLLPLEGVPATLANVRNGRYPLSRPLLVLTREPPRGLAGELIAFACSADVHDLVDKHGFVPAACERDPER